MTIKSIETAADHAAALTLLDTLFDAVPGTPEGDEAQALATLIQSYEKKHYPIDPPSPEAARQFRREQEAE